MCVSCGWRNGWASSMCSCKRWGIKIYGMSAVNLTPIPLGERSKAKVSRRSLAGIVGSNLLGACLSVSCECCHLEIPATGRSLIHGRPTDCDESLCVIYKTQDLGGPGLRWAVASEENNFESYGLRYVAADRAACVRHAQSFPGKHSRFYRLVTITGRTRQKCKDLRTLPNLLCLLVTVWAWLQLISGTVAHVPLLLWLCLYTRDGWETYLSFESRKRGKEAP